ncbi:hypothetical protein [Dactylosporangium sp. CA-092794]|uniref:hypothetical protein n=1 Tax=Dactylosporangium sp. CA-092794 TaxID=3239929 RepID=UPI003D8B6F7F
MRSRARAAAAVLGALLALAAPLAGPAPAFGQDILTVGADASVTLPPSGTATVSLAVAPAAGIDLADAGKPATVRVVQVLRDGVLQEAGDAVAARIEPAVPAIVLTVAADRLPAVGTYRVVLAVERAAVRQTVTVSLARPTGQLTVPAAIAVRHTVAIVPGGTADTVRPRLTVRPSSGTRLLDLTARQLEAEDPQIQVHIDANRLPLAPGAPLDLEYDITGKTEPGTVTRTVELTSPQLSAPVTVTFTVTTRRHPGLIAVTLVAGVLLSLLLRLVLPGLTNWRARHAERRRLDLQLAGLAEEYPDGDFRAAVATARGELGAAKGGELATAIDNARTQARTALAELRARLSTLDGDYRSWAVVLHRDWRLPAVLTGPIGAARDHLAAADTALAAHDAGAAEAAIASVRQAAQDLARAAADWGNDTGSALRRLADAIGERTAGALGPLREVVLRTRAGLPDPDTAAPAGSPDDLARRLDPVHLTMGRYPAVRRGLDAVAAEAGVIAAGLRERGQEADEVAADAAGLREADRREGDDPATAAGPVAAALQTLLTDTVAAIKRPLGSADAAEVDRLIAAGNLIGAAEAVLNRLPAPRGATGTRLGDAADVRLAAITAASTDAPAAPAVVLPPAHAPIGDRLRAAPGAIGLAVAGAGIAVLHSVAALVVVLLLGYALFLPGWSGSLADVSKVLVWAFAVDLSLTGLTARLAGQARPPAP